MLLDSCYQLASAQQACVAPALLMREASLPQHARRILEPLPQLAEPDACRDEQLAGLLQLIDQLGGAEPYPSWSTSATAVPDPHPRAQLNLIGALSPRNTQWATDQS
jgi:hypothetical protein